MAKYDQRLLEEELKNKVAADWFAAYDTTRIIGKLPEGLRQIVSVNVELEQKGGGLHCLITRNNLLRVGVSYAVHWCIPSNWINNQDQFLYPCNTCMEDRVFVFDCLVYATFHRKNRISSEHGVNHWIPFTEEEVGAQDCFESHFMSDFLAGKVRGDAESLPRQMELATPTRSGKDSASPLSASPLDRFNYYRSHEFGNDKNGQTGFVISTEARAVLDAGRELWRYYHKQPKANPNASYYDIRKFFQGMKVTAKGKEQMNPTSNDERYNELLAGLKVAMKKLAAKIEPKVYEYGFLRK